LIASLDSQIEEMLRAGSSVVEGTRSVGGNR
jgi:hypothetical protein